MITIPYTSWRGRYSPLVEVSILNNDRNVRTLAYLDTGATYSVFHSDFADELGLDLYSGERVDLLVGDGGMIPLYLFDLKLLIEGMGIDTRIGFSNHLGTGINIIGREYLLDEYMICFDGRKREIIWHI